MKEKIYYDIMKFISEESKILRDEPMKKHTSFKIGGNADIYIEAGSVEDILKIINYSKENNIELTVVGNGTNLLVKDNGIRGITLKPKLKKLEIDKKNNIVTVGSGIQLTYISQVLLKNELTGLEFASGIPGAIGGAIRMNAGAHEKEMKDVVISTIYITTDGEIKEIGNEEHKFGRRSSIFEKEKGVIIESKLKVEKGKYDEIKKMMTADLEYRKKAQPLEFASAGSTFKRGADFITAKLIDECGLKGYNIGGAQVSTKHAGFIINKGDATASDVLQLVELVKQKIKKEYNKDIELEVQIIGE